MKKVARVMKYELLWILFFKRILTTTSKFFKQELHLFPLCRIFVIGKIQWNKSTVKEKITV